MQCARCNQHLPLAGQAGLWHRAVDHAPAAGADAVILADIGVLDYAARGHPNLRRHLSVQAAAANALASETGIEIEVFAFGSVGPMSEGRCFLSPTSHVAYLNEDGRMLDALARGEDVSASLRHLQQDAEGGNETLGAYHKGWR